MKLTDAERASYLWGKLSKHINERIEKLRSNLEVIAQTPEQTTEIRGRIAELRSFVRLADPEPQKNSQQG
jgi:hypothetical protein